MNSRIIIYSKSDRLLELAVHFLREISNVDQIKFGNNILCYYLDSFNYFSRKWNLCSSHIKRVRIAFFEKEWKPHLILMLIFTNLNYVVYFSTCRYDLTSSNHFDIFFGKKVAVVVLFTLKGRNGFIFGNWKKVFSSKKRDFITPQGRAKACLF